MEGELEDIIDALKTAEVNLQKENLQAWPSSKH
jgi:hypothetical protein